MLLGNLLGIAVLLTVVLCSNLWDPAIKESVLSCHCHQQCEYHHSGLSVREKTRFQEKNKISFDRIKFYRYYLSDIQGFSRKLEDS